MTEPEWIEPDVVLAVHEAQLAEHGGSPGIRDRGLLESALGRPATLFHYLPEAGLTALAAAYAMGIVRNHAFLDGNKRTAWIVCALFLELNSVLVKADQVKVVQMMVAAASGEIEEEHFAAWLAEKDLTDLPAKVKHA